MWRLALIFFALHNVSCDRVNTHSRQKRFLIWPKGTSKIQAIAGFGIPVDLQRETVIIGSVMKANYFLPTNVSQLRPDIIYERRKKRSASRWSVYKLLENALEMRGVGDGKSCILKAICELAREPLSDKSSDLFAELTHLIFTPSSTYEELGHYTDSEYHSAQAFGKRGGKCDSRFQECTTSLMDMFTAYTGPKLDFKTDVD